MMAISALFEVGTGFCCLTLLALLGRALLVVCTRFFDLVRLLRFSSISSSHDMTNVRNLVNELFASGAHGL